MSPSPAPSSLDELPRRFGAYTLFDLIGKGGMAEIYLARARTELGATRLCVVKQILPAFADSPKFAEMLIHEAKLAALLNHAHVVQVFDLGREGGRLYIAMEYVEGLDLNMLLRKCSQKKESLPVEHMITIVGGVLGGLDYAHRLAKEDGTALGIVHRDVSPSNVLVSFDGEVKVCDFGIAHANNLVEGADLASLEPVRGKAGYMSPEHARGEALDARADVFAAGIVLWELLQGRRMYRPSSDVPLLEQAKRAEIPALASRGLPEEARLFEIVSRALSVGRDARYPSAGAMRSDLDDWAQAARLAPSTIRLGEWMRAELRDDALEQRRARERALDAKASDPPPPRSDEAILSPPRSPAPASDEMAIGERKSSPSDLPPLKEATISERPPRMLVPHISEGAMAAFKAGAVPPEEGPPHSLAGAAMDLGPASSPRSVAGPPSGPGLVVAVIVVLAVAGLLFALLGR
jgi:serine/threonine-protein kinase